MAEVKFVRGSNLTEEKLPVSDGQLIFDAATEKIYLDNEDGRVQLYETDISALKTSIDSKVSLVAAADASLVVDNGNENSTSTTPELKVKLSADSSNKLKLVADGLKVEVPSAASYTIKKEGTAAEGSAATYKLMVDGVQAGDAINIPKDMVVESGIVATNPDGAPKEGTYIILTLSNATNDKLYIPVDDLVDQVTSGSGDSDMVVIAINDQNQVRATVTDGSITKAKLETDVQTSLSKVDSALQADSIVSGSTNGTIAVKGTNVAVKGLGNAAYVDTTAFDAAGAANGVKTTITGTASDAAGTLTLNGLNKKIDAGFTWGSFS